MLELANIKFNDPYSLSTSSHRCIPAFLTLNKGNQLENGYIPFTQSIDEKLDPFEFE